MPIRGVYRRNISSNAQRERALLSAIGFTSAFATARGITHAIRAGVGPFHNISSGGRHIHHSTFGIFGLLGVGFLWAQQAFTGHDEPPRWGSRVTASTFGIAAALTLDEFALWMDLHDDYWDAQGRKSIDAVVIFGGLLTIVIVASEALDELHLMPGVLKQLKKLDMTSAGDASPAQTVSPPQTSSPAQPVSPPQTSSPAQTASQ